MAFSSMRPWLAGAAIAVSLVGTAHAQDAKTVFEARYAELSAAQQAKDVAKMQTMMTPDYTMIDIQGNEHGTAEMKDMLDKRPAAAEGMVPKITIVSAEISGATAKVAQQIEIHATRNGPDGQPAKLDITVQTADEWVQSGGTWLLKSSDQRDISVAKDGEVV
ncbi:MAG: nuclear transport factor 2 family protein, partial [Novosphingobium sp.]